MKFDEVLERFINYIAIDTQSDENSSTYPSTENQFNLAQILRKELSELGLSKIILDNNCYLTATLESNQKTSTKTIALIAHLDTSPEVPGKNVKPIIHHNYSGNDLILSKRDNIILRVVDNPELKNKIGHTIITSDGSTLLGADNKAGIAEILSAVSYLIKNPHIPRPDIRIIFTPDEEIGKGTQFLTKDQIGADIAYTIDGGKLGLIEDETFNAHSAEIIIRGINIHPGYAKNKMINTVKIASFIVNSLPPDRISPETTQNTEGFIHPYNMVCSVEESKINFILRDFEVSGLERYKKLLEKIINSATKKFPGSKIDLIITKSYENMKFIIDQHPQVIALALQAINESGITPQKNQVRGGTDGSKISFMGIPTPNLFTGGMNFHSIYEWISLEDMKKSVEVIVNLLKLWVVQKDTCI
jgi:tripeptide aminopeptidase